MLLRLGPLHLTLGPPQASHIKSLSTPSPPLCSYPDSGSALTATPRGHRINELTRRISSTSKYRRAAHAVETGEALELPWVRFWRCGKGSRWQKGDVVVVAARVLPFIWTANVNRVVTVERKRGRLMIGWGTSERHVLQGEEVLLVQREKQGVTVKLRSFSRPRAWIAFGMYPVVLMLQWRFARDVCKKVLQLADED